MSYTGFPALLDNYTVIPPDSGGAMNTQYVVTMLNTQVAIHSRVGVKRSNYPITLNAFWSAVSNGGSVFDPRILYDAAADRWIAAAVMNADSAESALLMGVSRTSDPGGDWHQFRINAGQSNWGDYPVLGFNGAWIAVSVNLFRVGGTSDYRGTTLYVFDRAELYAKANEAYTTFSDNQGELVPVRDQQNRPDTLYFVQTFADPGIGSIRISKLEGAPGSETFRGGNVGEIPVADPWSDTGPNGGADFAPQTGTTARIDTGDSRLQNCVMRTSTIWCTHTVFLPYGAPTHAAVQWFEIDPATLRLVQRGRIDDPEGTFFHAFPSIAVNRNDDALIGFTRFNSAGYASAGFAFRTAGDAPGAMQPVVIFKEGESSYLRPGSISGRNRWGDFSGTLVDPADDLTFWTIQEYASTPASGRNGRFGTWWARITAPSAGLQCSYSLSEPAQVVTSGASSGTLSVATSPGCPWMAAANVPWITIDSGTPGTGSGTVRYSIAPNPTSATSRSGTVTIAQQTFTVTQSVPPVSIDLAVTAMNGPSNAQPGQPMSLTALVVNGSSSTAGAFRIGLYIGAGTSIAATDPILGSCTVAGLAAGAAATCNQTVSLPATIQPGRYVLGAIADDLNQLADPDRSNNTRLSESGAITVTSAGQRPAFPTNGVVNAASYRGGAVAPGELVTVFGSNLGPPQAQYPEVSGDGVVARIAGGTRVLFDGIAAPMISAIAGQVSAVAPFAVRGRPATQIEVEYLGVRSDPIAVPVALAAPAIFTVDQSGLGPGAIRNQDFSLNTAGRPALRGSVVMIYATGAGYQAEAAEGVLAQPPFVNMAQSVEVRIGGVPAVVTYAGKAPGLIAGVVQINAVVPEGAAAGPAVPVELTVAGITGPAGVTLAVGP